MYMNKIKYLVCVLCMLLLLSGCSHPFEFLWTIESFTGDNPLQYGKEGSDSTLLVIQQNDLFGYADLSGRVVIKPKYSFARPFYDGLAAVERNGKYGYIDLEGKQVTPFKYYGALDYHNGLVVVSYRLRDGVEFLKYEKASVIDQKGQIVKDTDYIWVSEYSEGIIKVMTYERSFHLLDEKLNEVNLPDVVLEGAVLSVFSEGLALFSRKGASCIEFIDRDGAQPFEGKFADAMVFTNGLAPVKYWGSDLWGYVEKSGSMVIDPTFQTAGNFGEGLAIVQKDGRWLLIDPSGRETASIQIIIDTSMTFQEGLCPVGRLKEEDVSYGRMSLDYDWGFIDTTGKLVIDFQYDMVTPFKNGIAQVLVDGKIGYIDKTGKYIWEPK